MFLPTRAVRDDKKYNQDEVDVIGSLFRVQNKPGRVHFTLQRQDIVHDVYLSLFYTEIKKFVKLFKPSGMNAKMMCFW